MEGTRRGEDVSCAGTGVTLMKVSVGAQEDEEEPCLTTKETRGTERGITQLEHG